MRSKLLSVRIPYDVYEPLKVEAAGQRRSVASLIVYAVERELGKRAAQQGATERTDLGRDRKPVEFPETISKPAEVPEKVVKLAEKIARKTPARPHARKKRKSEPAPRVTSRYRELPGDAEARERITAQLAAKPLTVEEQKKVDGQGRYRECSHGRNMYRCSATACKMLTGR